MMRLQGWLFVPRKCFPMYGACMYHTAVCRTEHFVDERVSSIEEDTVADTDGGEERGRRNELHDL